MATCLNRIVMNIIKSKCIGNSNLRFVGKCDSYEAYNLSCFMSGENESVLSKEEYTFIKTWINKKPRGTKNE